MILTTSLLVAILGGTSTLAAPVSRSQRDSEVITEAMGPWVTECQAQSGGQYCVELAANGVRALGPKAAVCAQQDMADSMIAFAATLQNRTALINLTKTYAQQARSSADGFSVLYCQDAPAATQLSGIYPCQSADYDLTKFTGGVAIGAAGTIPFGLTAAVTPAGSCPDHSGPIPSGEYITDSASKAAANKAKSKSNKSSGKQMTLIHPFEKRDEEGGEAVPEEGSTEEALPGDDAAEPPADEANPDATSAETGSEPQPTDAPENAAESPSPTESTSAATPTSSTSAAPSSTGPPQPIIAIAPGSPQAVAMSQALVSMTNALASASNAVSQAACGISEAAKAIAKIAASLVQQPNAAPPPSPSPSPPCPESSSSAAPSPTSTDGPAPTDAPPQNAAADPNAPAPSSTEGGDQQQPSSTSDGAAAPTPTEGEGESQNQEANADPRGPQPDAAAAEQPAEQADGGDGGEGGGEGGDE